MLAQLVKKDQVAGESTAAAPRCGSDPVLAAGDEPHKFGMALVDLLDQIAEFFVGLCPFDRFAPGLLGVGEILRGSDHGR